MAADIGEAQGSKVGAVDEDATGLRIQMPNEQVGEGGLPDPARPDDGDARSGLDGERYAVENRLTTIEAERDVFELDLTADMGQSPCVRLLDDVDGRVEDLVHAAQGHARRGDARVEAHQALNRAEQPHLISDERDECPHRDDTIDHAPAADEEHRGAAGGEDQTRESTGAVRQSTHPHQRIDEGVVALPKARDLALLSIGGDNELHSHQRFEQKRSDGRTALSHVADGQLETRAVSHERPQD